MEIFVIIPDLVSWKSKSLWNSFNEGLFSLLLTARANSHSTSTCAHVCFPLWQSKLSWTPQFVINSVNRTSLMVLSCLHLLINVVDMCWTSNKWKHQVRNMESYYHTPTCNIEICGIFSHRFWEEGSVFLFQSIWMEWFSKWCSLDLRVLNKEYFNL